MSFDLDKVWDKLSLCKTQRVARARWACANLSLYPLRAQARYKKPEVAQSPKNSGPTHLYFCQLFLKRSKAAEFEQRKVSSRTRLRRRHGRVGQAAAGTPSRAEISGGTEMQFINAAAASFEIRKK